VSNNFVGEVRKAICHPMTDSPATPATRTASGNGTVYEQKAKTRPVSAEKPQNSGELAPAPVSNKLETSGRLSAFRTQIARPMRARLS